MAATAAKPRAAGRARFAPFSDAPVYVIAIVLAAAVIVPIVYIALGGFRPTEQLAGDPFAFPHPWIVHNYTNVLTSEGFWRQVGNIAIIAAIATIIVVG